MDGEEFNRKIFSIQASGPRLTLATATFLLASISIFGNFLVLMAALRNSIKLDKVSVILLKNIAVADLAYALLVIIEVKCLSGTDRPIRVR